MNTTDLPAGFEAGVKSMLERCDADPNVITMATLISICVSQQRIAGELYGVNATLRRIADALERS